MRQTLPALLLASLVAAALPASARDEAAGPHGWCGTSPARIVEAEARHRLFERRIGSGRMVPTKALDVRKAGAIAVIDDDGTLISRANPFDLDGTAFQFKRNNKGYRANPSGAGFGGDLGDRLTIGDDESVLVQLPYAIRFYGERYDAFFVNSDGNVTFGEADSASTARSVSRFLSGPPRIAPLFVDLDPSQTSGAAGVFVADLGGRVQITWQDVPEFGSSNVNTFQVTIYRNGRILTVYDQIDATAAVVGISPGGDHALLELVDYDAELPIDLKPLDVAIAERFTASSEFDDLGAARVFLQHFRDIYDHVIIWLDYFQDLGGAFAYEITARNEIQGIGVPISDFSDQFGSDGRLRSYVQMGTLSRYPTDPDKIFLGTNSTMGVFGQEAGHRWLAFVGFRDASGNRSLELLGRQQAHWSFYMDSDASVMEGNDIRDDGNGSFTTVAATERYSLLDQYVMGLIPPEDVPPFFFVGNAQGRSAAAAPEIGVRITGTRVDLTVDDVIAAQGARVPASANAPKAFNMAFVVVGRQGQPVSQDSIAKVDRIRRRWIEFFGQATDGRGRVKTPLRIKR